MDLTYLASLPKPVAPWGAQRPHEYMSSSLLKFALTGLLISPTTGIFSLARTIQRPLPTETDNVTHEYIHSSGMYEDTSLMASAQLHSSVASGSFSS